VDKSGENKVTHCFLLGADADYRFYQIAGPGNTLFNLIASFADQVFHHIQDYVHVVYSNGNNERCLYCGRFWEGSDTVVCTIKAGTSTANRFAAACAASGGYEIPVYKENPCQFRIISLVKVLLKVRGRK